MSRFNIQYRCTFYPFFIFIYIKINFYFFIYTLMKQLNSFDKFPINESLGIAEATMFYTKRLTNIVIDEFYKYVDRTRSLGDDVVDTQSIDIRIPYRQLYPLIPSNKRDIYEKFPLSEIIMTIDFCKKTSKEMFSMSDDIEVGYMIGGYASNFAKGREKYATRFVDPIRQNTDHSLSIHFGVGVNYGPKFKKISQGLPLFEKTHLFKKIESVIAHELNHLYEYYNRKLSGVGKFGLSMTWASIGDNIYGVPKQVYDYWQNYFTDYIYQAEPHEINAQSQEAMVYVEKLPFDRFRNTKTWKSGKNMQNFDYKEFINGFGKIITDNRLNKSGTIDHMVSIFKKDYENLVAEYEENPKIKPAYLNRMSTEEFFNFFQKEINNAGNTLIRNFCRLYALKK